MNMGFLNKCNKDTIQKNLFHYSKFIFFSLLFNSKATRNYPIFRTKKKNFPDLAFVLGFILCFQ